MEYLPRQEFLASVFFCAMQNSLLAERGERYEWISETKRQGKFHALGTLLRSDRQRCDNHRGDGGNGISPGWKNPHAI